MKRLVIDWLLKQIDYFRNYQFHLAFVIAPAELAMEAPLTICVGQTPDKKRGYSHWVHKLVTMTSAFCKHTLQKDGPSSEEKHNPSIRGSPAANTDAHAHNDDGDRREEDLPPSHV